MPEKRALVPERIDVEGFFEKHRLRLIRTKLDNGLKVILIEDHHVPLVSVQVYYLVGSRNESYGVTGISHFLEHMMFKGTHRFGPEEISNIITSWGGTDNAMTGKDMTVYWSLVPSDKLPQVLDMEADRMQNAVFREFDSEKMVVMEERRLHYENNPYVLLMEEMDSIAIQAHPYRHPVIGWMSDIESFTIEDLENHYRTFYVPNNAILVVSGDFDQDETLRLITEYFGGIEPGEPPEVRTREPSQNGERRSFLFREGWPRVWAVAYHIPEFKHPDYPPILMASMALNSGRSSRLHRRLVETGLATEVDIIMEKTIDPFLLMVWVTPSENAGFDEIESAVFSEIEKLAAESITEPEHIKIMNNQATAFATAQETVLGKGNIAGEFEVIGGAGSYESWIKRLAAVTPEDIGRVVGQYLVEKNRTVILMGSGGKP